MTNKRAICTGINDYPGTGNDLQGCLNDCSTWADLLSKNGFSVTKFQDSAVTRQTIKTQLSKLVSEAVSGDVLVFTYSGHGSFVVDMNNPEPDHKNETLYAFDGNVFDYEIRSILDGLKDGVSMTIIFDSCHSGTLTRMVHPGAPKPRFMPPSDPAMAALGYLPTARRIFIPESQMKETLFAGCKDSEYSYDAKFGATPYGAFSYVATNILKNNINLTNQQFYDLIRKQLPSNEYPQSPQLESNDTNRLKKVFT